MKVTTSWVQTLAFDVTADTGQTVRIDTTVENGGSGTGMNPKKMLLGSLCGCSGIDVVDILHKMKVPFTKLEIEASAEQTDDHPKVFKFIDMVYRSDISADNIDKLNRAVSLSHEKYCGISAMLGKHCPINYTVELI
ncbi:MAG TPA: osmotically inducible protein OsmC [Chitinophagaceae bacterium]|jgi:putative redox protein|nr:osmotically inducible protein OsmC [Chitinophagaceae bacterium]